MNNLMALGYTNNIPGTVEGKRLSSGVVERSKIESFLVRIQLLVGFGLFHQLIEDIYCNWENRPKLTEQFCNCVRDAVK